MFNGMFIITIIIALFLNLSYGIPRILDEIAEKRSDHLNYHLTKSVFPEHYTLKMAPDFKNSTFKGYVKILIHVKAPTENITLHQKDLNITKDKIHLTTKDDLVINIKDAGPSGTKEQEFYTITFPEKLTKNTYYLHIPEFYGHLSLNLKGFHKAHYTDEKGKLHLFGMTFFEPLGARLAFPCFDEPSFRAKFKIYIIRPSNYHSVSNSKLIKSIKLNNSLYEDEFEDTVSMSTYLVSFSVSDMKLATSPDSNKFRILARPEVLRKGYEKNSLKLSIKILKALETYLNVNYTLSKMDQAVVPDECFAADGLESWGFITYRESIFLITPETSTKREVRVALVVAHELAHQWFGNLVTMKWWRYLWLKEGFAQFFQSKILDIVKPEWKLMERYVAIEKHDTLERDLHRDMNQDAGTRNEISRLYDHISYEKSGCVVHMFEALMTPEIFRRGLTNYFQDRAFESAIPRDLSRNLQKSLDNSAIKLPQNVNIEKIMSTWASQEGYPLVYVERDYDKNQKVVKLTQSRFVEASFTPKPSNWYIPINYASKSNPNFNDTGFSNWLLKPKETITIRNLKSDDWLILNKQQAYYYRVNYDVENWKLIAKALKENYRKIHVLNRAQLIDDSFNLLKQNRIDISVPLEISSYVYQEDYYIIHSVFLRNIKNIEEYVRGTNIEQKFRNFVIRSLKRSYHRLGNDHRASDTLIDKLHRIEVVNWMCKFNYSQCRENTWKSFDQWRKNNKSVELDLEDQIMCNAIRYGSEDDWNYLHEYFISTGYGFDWLACTENVTILQKFINSSLDPSAKYRIAKVMKAISGMGFVGLNVSKHYAIEHMDYITSMGSMFFHEILDIIIPSFLTETQLDRFMALVPKRITNVGINLLIHVFRLEIPKKQKKVRKISKFLQSYNPPNDLDQGRSDGNLCQVIPNIFSFILYGLIMFVMFVYNN